MTGDLRSGLGKQFQVSLLILGFTTSMLAQDNPPPTLPGTSSPQTSAAPKNSPSSSAPTSPQKSTSVSLEMAKSRNPFSAYSPSLVPEPQLSNSPLLTQLIRDGKLYLSLK